MEEESPQPGGNGLRDRGKKIWAVQSVEETGWRVVENREREVLVEVEMQQGSS